VPDDEPSESAAAGWEAHGRSPRQSAYTHGVSDTLVGMAMTVPCRRCGAEVSAETEDALVEKVAQHIREVHNSPHVPPREHLLEHARHDGDDRERSCDVA